MTEHLDTELQGNEHFIIDGDRKVWERGSSGTYTTPTHKNDLHFHTLQEYFKPIAKVTPVQD